MSTEQDRYVALDSVAIEDLRETHRSDPARTFQFMCMACGEPFPCRTLHLAAEVEQLRAQVVSQKAVLDAYGRQTERDMAQLERAERVIEAVRGSLDADHAYHRHKDTCASETCMACGVLGSQSYDRHSALVGALAAYDAGSRSGEQGT